MSAVAGVVERAVAAATITTARGAASAVVRDLAPVATVAAGQGPAGPPGKDGITHTTIFTQAQSATVWTMNHGLGRYPSVTVIDTAGDQILVAPFYVDASVIVLTFSAPTAGTAYLN